MTREEIAAFYRDKLGVTSDRSVSYLVENTRFVHRPAGHWLREAGEDLNTVLIHLSGVARCYVIDDRGQENIIGFFYKPGGVRLGAAGLQEKSFFNVDAVTDMDLLELSIPALKHCVKNDLSLLDLIAKLLSDRAEEDYRWNITLKTKFGRDRYQWFLEEYAPCVGVVTQKDIASFLNLRPQSLSRIKIQLNKELAGEN